MLDDIAYGNLAAYIRAFQNSLASDTSALLGFSTLCASTPSSNAQFVLVCMPFLPRQYMRHSRLKTIDRVPHSARRTLLPVLTSLENILQLLCSGPQALTIDSVQNVSEQYIGCLQDYIEDLTHESSIRNKFVAQWGMEGWREEQLMGYWEAALFSSGILARWLVVVRK